MLYAPLGFFLQNPVGEMLVAFTKDQDMLDENLMDTLHYLGIYGLIMLSTVITVSVVIPHFAAFAGVLILVTVVMLRYYLPAATALKKQKMETAGGWAGGLTALLVLVLLRVQDRPAWGSAGYLCPSALALTRACPAPPAAAAAPTPPPPPPGDLVGLVAETLEGLPIITAFSQNKYFVSTAAHKIDEHHRALFNGESLNLWLAFYCDLYGAILVLAVCIFAVVMKDILGPAAVGLAFSNTIQVRARAELLCLLSWAAVCAELKTHWPGWRQRKSAPLLGGPAPPVFPRHPHPPPADLLPSPAPPTTRHADARLLHLVGALRGRCHQPDGLHREDRLARHQDPPGG